MENISNSQMLYCVFCTVCFSAVLSSYLLGEVLNMVGKLGCLLCVLGSILLVIHAPQEQEVTSLQDMTNKLLEPGEKKKCCQLHVAEKYKLKTVRKRRENCKTVKCFRATDQTSKFNFFPLFLCPFFTICSLKLASQVQFCFFSHISIYKFVSMHIFNLSKN